MSDNVCTFVDVEPPFPFLLKNLEEAKIFKICTVKMDELNTYDDIRLYR